ncbi:Hypothetical predicted protein [Prunus dulcis]|uniref:Uncharacterized protein n=1 Tax=Prunus dulcis TaxID=3755 RepID=A0A5E4G5W3_PRUDU|nr:Hypothetical predicted protein [Prunus dulcis]
MRGTCGQYGYFRDHCKRPELTVRRAFKTASRHGDDTEREKESAGFAILGRRDRNTKEGLWAIKECNQLRVGVPGRSCEVRATLSLRDASHRRTRGGNDAVFWVPEWKMKSSKMTTTASSSPPP